MTRTICPALCLCAAVTINACSGGGGGGGGSICAPGIGQWCSFPSYVNSNSFVIGSQTVGYVYTMPPQVAPGLTVTLDYTVTGNDNNFSQAPNSNDTNPATISLLLWRKGDDLSCQGAMQEYRLFVSHIAPLQLGHNVVSAPLLANNWTDCYGQTNPSGFLGALENVLGIGFALGGKNFDGHGVVGDGQIFTINSFTVK